MGTRKLTWLAVGTISGQRLQRNSRGVLPRGSNVTVPGGHPQAPLPFCETWLLSWRNVEGEGRK